MKMRICFFCMAFAPLLLWGQTYSSDLAKTAKRGDIVAQRDLGICYLKGAGVNADDKKAYKWLSSAANAGSAEAMYYLATMYEQGRVKNSTPELAWDWYERAATGGDVNAQMKMAHKLESETNPYAINWYLKAASQSNAEAQYKCGLFAYQQFKSSGAEPMTTKDWNTAKDYFQKATAQGYSEARPYLSEINQTEQAIEAEKARLRAIEQARRDSIARVEAEQRRVQDSIDYSTGKRLPPRMWLLERGNVYETDIHKWNFPYEFTESKFYEQYIALCENDVLAYFGKSKLDDLDKSIYTNSEQYISDLEEFKRKKSEFFVLTYPLDDKVNWKFFSDGFSFHAWSEATEDFGNYRPNYMAFRELIIPIKSNLVTLENYYTHFKLDNVEELLKIRELKSDLELVYIFKVGTTVISYIDGSYSHKKQITYPTGLYLVNRKTGNTLVDLSYCLRKPNLKDEKQKIEAAAKANYKRSQQRSAQSNRSSRNQPMVRRTCPECMGSGVYIWQSGNRQKCWTCDGKGYTESYY